jgi:hypothetical protein
MTCSGRRFAVVNACSSKDWKRMRTIIAGLRKAA